MTATTGRGFPYPEPTDDNNIPADMQALAEAVDTMPGVAVLTTAQRDALSGAELWAGRVIANTTTGTVQQYRGASIGWVDIAESAVRTVFTASGTWTKPAGLRKLVVEAIGAGGSGGSGMLSSGGGGGGYAVETFNAEDLPATVPVTVGAGGASVAKGNAGLDGGESGFGGTLFSGVLVDALLTASGGAGGVWLDDTVDDGDSGSVIGGKGGGITGGQGGVIVIYRTTVNFGTSSISVKYQGLEGRSSHHGGGGGGVANGWGFPEWHPACYGGSSIYGGGGGGGYYSDSGGASQHAGAGGAGSSDSGTAAGSGSAPGGGGGCQGHDTSGVSGAGARGEVRLTEIY
ncbi:glycine-rich domain-containing protein [Nocardioides sp. GY 10127]|uniref:glycine-rich domain-containing protein n=1 Tax=Nocardioides sp. GY 10127 TaxID=2569762 RepID=UPI0010A774C9|nr:hypothetical protein [Nocardioides sp. GY 10127]TIC78770.1 hypothetical protein E8D37_18920 [Nocardioides sp. GY 10127]